MPFIRFSYFSKSLETCTEFWALLPDFKGNNTKLPCLYLLHGLSDDHSIWMRRTSLERYMEGKEMAVIMPNGGRSYYTDMKHGLKYAEFIGKELPEVVQKYLPVSGKASDRYIAGLSMGGYGAFRTALANPRRYRAAMSFSGALDPLNAMGKKVSLFKDLSMSFGSLKEFKNSSNDLPYLLTKHIKSHTPIPDLFQWCGTEDFLYEQNQNFLAFCRKKGVSVFYREGLGGHTWDKWDEQIQLAIEWIYEKRGKKLEH